MKRKSEERKTQNFQELNTAVTKNKRVEFKQHFATGLRFYKKGDYDSAIAEFQKALALKPGNKKTKEYFDLAQQKKSRITFDQLSGQATAHEAQQHYAQALDVYRKMLEIAEGDGFSLYEIELVRARVEKMEWFESQRTQGARQPFVEAREGEPSLAETPPPVSDEKESRASDTSTSTPAAPAYGQENKSLLMDEALHEAEDAFSERDKHISELLTSIPSQTTTPAQDRSTPKELNKPTSIRQVRDIYNGAKEYYKRAEYLQAIEAFKQVLTLEEGFRTKRYSPHAERYIERANVQLKKQIEKELLEREEQTARL